MCWVLLVILLAGGAAACGGEEEAKPKADATADATSDASGDALADVANDAANDGAGDGGGGGLPAVDPNPDCDPLQPSWCALPWPSNRFLAPGPSQDTGLQLAFGATTLPANKDGVHVDPKVFARMDGYGVGTAIVVHFPDIDTKGFADEDDLGPSMAQDAPIALWDLGPAKAAGATPKRVPYWAELDGHAWDKSKQALLIRPGILLQAAHRYVVAFRGLKTADGKPIAASEAFAALRDDKTAGTFLAPRQAAFKSVFEAIEAAGWKRTDLVLAWDFVTASGAALHGDLLHVRDKSFEIAGDLGAEITVTKVESFSKDQDPHMAAWITGEMTVPDFTEQFEVGARLGANQIKGVFGARLRRGADGKPEAKGQRKATWWAVVPHTALDGSPHGIVQYGHGLLGMGDQVKGSFNRKIAFDGQLIFFACNWTGMAEEDEAAIQQMIFDFSDFYMIPERLHQGMAEFLLLGRAMRERFDSLAQIKALNVKVDKGRFYYSGISQGGIYGATYMALSKDVTRGHLGVPGQNYSLLLHRSVDFAPFLAVMTVSYPLHIDRQLVLMAVQGLWDQVDPSSHYVHIHKQPHPGTPPHQVLLASAKGDWQVALKSNEVVARSDVGVALMPGYGKKVWDVAQKPFPLKGSALVNYDFGNPWAKLGNLPDETKIAGKECGPQKMCLKESLCPDGGSANECQLADPHGKPRKLDHHNAQMLHFFATGEVKDVCGGDGCTPQ